MKYTISLFFLLLTLSISGLIGRVYAPDEDINLENLPSQLAEAWGITEFAAGLFMSTLLGLAFLFPIAIWKQTTLAPLIVGFGVMGFCIAIGWLPYWIMLLIVLAIVSLFASKLTKPL